MATFGSGSNRGFNPTFNPRTRRVDQSPVAGAGQSFQGGGNYSSFAGGNLPPPAAQEPPTLGNPSGGQMIEQVTYGGGGGGLTVPNSGGANMPMQGAMPYAGSRPTYEQFSQMRQQQLGQQPASTDIETQFRRANAANEARYQQLLGGYGDRMDMSANLYQGERANQQEMLDRGLAKNTAKLDQNMISRGLYNTTVAPQLQRGVQEDYDLQSRQMNLAVADRQNAAQLGAYGDLLGAIERRTDQAPNVLGYAQLAAQVASRSQNIGNVSLGGGGGAGGGRVTNVSHSPPAPGSNLGSGSVPQFGLGGGGGYGSAGSAGYPGGPAYAANRPGTPAGQTNPFYGQGGAAQDDFWSGVTEDDLDYALYGDPFDYGIRDQSGYSTGVYGSPAQYDVGGGNAQYDVGGGGYDYDIGYESPNWWNPQAADYGYAGGTSRLPPTEDYGVLQGDEYEAWLRSQGY